MVVISSDDERPSTIPEELTITEMTEPTMQTSQSEEKLNIPAGSERVVNIRCVPAAPTTPLTINTQMTMPEREIHHEITSVHRRHRSEQRLSSRRHHRHSYKKSSGRKTKAWSTELADNTGQRRVLSCLELNVEPHSEYAHPVPVHSDGEQVTHTHVRKRCKSHRKHRRTEHGSWVSVKADNMEDTNWRYSNIFTPESPKVRPRKHKHHKSRTITIKQSPGSQIWREFIPFPIAYYPPPTYSPCRRCDLESPTRTCSHEIVGVQPFPHYPYPAQSSENIFTPHCCCHHHHHHYYSPRVNTYCTRTIPPVGRITSEATLLSTSGDHLDHGDSDGYEQMLMEIQYAPINEDDTQNKMTQENLQQIMKLAKQFCKMEKLQEMAKHIKMALDKKFGERWHVIVSAESFGSYLASLPRTLANFRINDLVFLIWQT